MVLIPLTAEHDKSANKIVIKFYDTESRSLVMHSDQTGFRPYCIANIDYNSFYTFCYKNAQNATTLKKKGNGGAAVKKIKNDDDDDESEEENDGDEDVDENTDDEAESDDEIITAAKKDAIKKSAEDSVPIIPSLPIQKIRLYNAIKKQHIDMVKVVGVTVSDILDPYNSGGVNITRYLMTMNGDQIVDNYVYENTIRHVDNYMIDNKIVFGMPYTLETKEVMVLEPEKCHHCNGTSGKGYYHYYIAKKTQPGMQNVIVGRVSCDNCSADISNDKNITESDSYIPYFTIFREFDLKEVKKQRVIPVAIPSQISPEKQKMIESLFVNERKEEQDLIKEWIPYFFSDFPIDIYRAVFDIEVYSKNDSFGDVLDAINPVSCVSFVDSDGKKVIFYLKICETEGIPIPEFPPNVKIMEYNKNEEREMLIDIFNYMDKYPMLVTFNGNNFDFAYLYYRATKALKMDKEIVPYTIKAKKGKFKGFYYNFKFFVHLDLYEFFSRKALKAYSFKNAYQKDSLKEITKALLPKGESKAAEGIVDAHGVEKPQSQYTKNELLYYNVVDSIITFKLTTFNNSIVMMLLFLFMRMSKVGLDDFTSHQISFWLRSLIFYQHRQMGWLIPQDHEIRSITKSCTVAKSSTKQFEGGHVAETVPGIHFDVVVLDFASLYPSIIKTKNLSYETVDCCSHPECKTNIIPDTTHHVCTKVLGIISLIIGTIRDIRVLYFKEMEERNKDRIDEYKKNNKVDEALALQNENQLYSVIQNSLKVFINAGYGVFASATFYFFQIGMGEGVTAYGRYDIMEVINQAEKVKKILVCGSDTDSAFLVHPSKEDVNYLIKWAWDNIHISLDKDKECKYMAISKRKKNYVMSYYQKGNITPESPIWKKMEIKGMKGKKSNTPQYIKTQFQSIIKKIDSNINKQEDIKAAKADMKNHLFSAAKAIIDATVLAEKPEDENKKVPLSELIYYTKLSKNVIDYGNSETRDYNKNLFKMAINGKNIKRGIELNESDEPKTQDQRVIEAYRLFVTKGMNQCAKCALLALQNGIKIGVGDVVPIVKVKNNYGGSMPISVIKTRNQLDLDTYLGELESTFSQLYDCFDLDSKEIIDRANGKVKMGDVGKMMGGIPKKPKTQSESPIITQKTEEKNAGPMGNFVKRRII